MQPAYESGFRRKGFALASLGILLLVLFAVIAFALVFIEDGNDALPVILSAAGLVVAGIFFVLAAAFRVHRWTIETGGLRIEERPKVPLTGRRRQAFVQFRDIVALRHLESGFDRMVELVARNGETYHLMQAQPPIRLQGQAPMPQAPIEGFLAELSRAVAAAAPDAPGTPVVEALSFWNRTPGLIAIMVMFVISLGIAGATLWALFGGGLEYRARQGEAIAIFLLLPFGVGYLFWKSLQRRRRVLGALAGGRTP
jgi:hypothetical protein